jgi:hypothetical protein
MSVGLKILNGGSDFDDIEVMAPDYGKEYLWLWQEADGENRIDLSRDQLREFRDFLNEIL